MGNKYTLHEEEKEKENKLIKKLTNTKEIKKLYRSKRKLYEQTERQSTTHKKQLLRYIQTLTTFAHPPLKLFTPFAFLISGGIEFHSTIVLG